jgi:hypothetical protein
VGILPCPATILSDSILNYSVLNYYVFNYYLLSNSVLNYSVLIYLTPESHSASANLRPKMRSNSRSFLVIAAGSQGVSRPA